MYLVDTVYISDSAFELFLISNNNLTSEFLCKWGVADLIKIFIFTLLPYDMQYSTANRNKVSPPDLIKLLFRSEVYAKILQTFSGVNNTNVNCLLPLVKHTKAKHNFQIVNKYLCLVFEVDECIGISLAECRVHLYKNRPDLRNCTICYLACFPHFFNPFYNKCKFLLISGA